MATESLEHLIGFSNFISVFGGMALFGCALLFVFYYAGTFHVDNNDEKNDKIQMRMQSDKTASSKMGHGGNHSDDPDDDDKKIGRKNGAYQRGRQYFNSK